jgi:polysaccharide biosynthesis/export protein
VRFILKTRLVIAVAIIGSAQAVLAQQSNPTAAQAQQLMQGRSGLSAQLRARLLGSGLTPDQIRSRLEEQGYPDSLLDAYLPGNGESGELDTLPPSAEVLNAISQLGLIDSAGVDSLIGTSRLDSTIAKRNRGLLADTVDTNFTALSDSLLYQKALRQLKRPADAYRFDTTADTAEAADSLRFLQARIRVLLADTSITPDRKRRLLNLIIPQDSALKLFGVNLFRKEPNNQFSPLTAGPVDSSYRIQPGDRLVLILTGQVELARTLIVTREGFTVVPQVGEIDVANLTLAQLTDVFYERLGRVYSGVRRGPNATTHFSISMARLHANQIYVTGDVMQPGSYQVSGAGTALTALYAAGGPNPQGSLRHVQVRRGGRLIDSLDVYDYLLHGDASHDVRLQTGDVVFVPTHGPRVAVAGEIVRPAIYEIRTGETLADLLREAGGFEPYAGRRRVQVTRYVQPDTAGRPDRGRVVIDVTAPDLDATAAAAGTSIPLVAGDSVKVFRMDVRLRNGLTVTGDVWTPGDVGFEPGLRLSDAIKLAGGLKPDAYLGTVLVARLRPDSTREQLRTSLKDSSGTPTDDIVLEAHDDIRIFAIHDMRPRRYVAISGAVRQPGRFAYHDGMTMRDLVLLAGGTTEDASFTEAEIARLPENRAGGVTAVTTRVPFDSTYLVTRMVDNPTAPKPIDPPEVPLQPYDNVLIFRETGWTLPRTVAVTGEVKSPGRYTLTTKNERLRDVLLRAGGPTKAANPDGLTLIRKEGKGVTRVGVDVQTALDNPKSRANIVIQDGDSIYVPPNTGVVRVAGAVNAPVTVSYVPGKNLNYYVSAAGGFGTRADPGRAYVKEPDGTVDGIRHHGILPASIPVPRPGAEVFVPDKEIRLEKPDQTLQYIGLAVQMIAGLATVIYLTQH